MGTAFYRDIIGKFEIGDMTYAQSTPQFPAQKAGGVIQSIHRLGPVAGLPQLGDVDLGMSQITGNINGGDSDKSDTGILQLALNQLSQLTLNLLTKPTGTTELFCHGNRGFESGLKF